MDLGLLQPHQIEDWKHYELNHQLKKLELKAVLVASLHQQHEQQMDL